MIPKAGVGLEYLFGLLESEEFLSRFEKLVTGTSRSHQRVRPEGLLGMLVIRPTEDVIKAFSVMVEPLHQERIGLKTESDTLKATRDALLPKLLSGEIRIKDAEKLVGAVA